MLVHGAATAAAHCSRRRRLSGRPQPSTRPPRGTLDARRVELKDKVGAEPEDDVWLTYPEDGWMDPDVHDQRKLLAKRVSSNQH